MKKTMIVIFAVISIMLSACQGSTELHKGSEQDKIGGPGKFISTLEEYNDYIAEAELPDGFIRYSQLTELGAFKSFKNNPLGLPAQSYRYTFVDTNNGRFDLVVYKSDETILPTNNEITSLPEATADMFCVPDTTYNNLFKYNRNGLEYYYYGYEGNGARNIAFIEYVEDNTRYKISGDLLDYPNNNQETFFTRLMSINETKFTSAFEELKACINVSN